MFKLTHQLPSEVVIACSGGMDSMAALHWLNKSHKVKKVINIHHQTGNFADQAADFVEKQAKEMGLEVEVLKITEVIPPSGVSKEEWWRDQRYQLLEKATNLPIIIAHQMNDCLEEYLINTIVRGRRGTIPYRRGKCIRPFRQWKKIDLCNYIQENDIHFLDDPSNKDTKYLRNFVRINLVPHTIQINPGIWKIIREQIAIQDIRDREKKNGL